MKTNPILFIVTLLAVFAGAISSTSAELSVASTPPVVVKTVPAAGATAVDPEIQVAFSKAMQDGSWSWATVSEESFPKLNGQPRYLPDGKTCVLPVKLEPGKTYAIWVNSEKFKNFKDKSNKPAVPYLLVFETKR